MPEVVKHDCLSDDISRTDPAFTGAPSCVVRFSSVQLHEPRAAIPGAHTLTGIRRKHCNSTVHLQSV